jgi:hypothetical protein
MSERLGDITKKTLRQGGVHGHLPVPLQRAANYTLADRFNRLPNVNGTAAANPKIVNNDAVLGALKSDPKFPVTNNIKRIGGLNLTETARRGLTKVSGPVSLAFGAADVANQIAHGVKPGEAIGKTASGIAVSGAASALTTAAIAAAVPGAGWAVAGGIVVGLGASYAWDALGGSKLAAKAGGWVQDRVTDGAKAVADGATKAGSAIADGAKKAGSAIADGAKNAGNAVKHFFGF